DAVAFEGARFPIGAESLGEIADAATPSDTERTAERERARARLRHEQVRAQGARHGSRGGPPRRLVSAAPRPASDVGAGGVSVGDAARLFERRFGEAPQARERTELR